MKRGKDQIYFWILIEFLVLFLVAQPADGRGGSRAGGGGFVRRGVPINNLGQAQRVPQYNQNGVVANNAADKAINNNDLKSSGFSNIRIAGKQIVEVNFDGSFRQKLFIDQGGRLFGQSALRRDTSDQLSDFYVRNFNNFGRRDAGIVNRFLGARQRRPLGTLIVDMDGAVDVVGKENKKNRYAGVSKEQLELAILNYALNSVSRLPNLMNIRNYSPVLGLNLSGALNENVLRAITNDNPYACGAKDGAPMRLDWMVTRMFADPQVYYQLTNAPNTEAELAGRLGVSDQRLSRRAQKVVVNNDTTKGQKESIVAFGPRVLEEQQQRDGQVYYKSFDFKSNEFGFQTNSITRNPADNPLGFAHDGGEVIYRLPNGMQAFFNTNGDGGRLDTVPAEVAFRDRGVSAGHMCMKCHPMGSRGAHPAVHKTDVVKNASGQEKALVEQFYTPLENYRAVGERDNSRWRNTLKRGGSFIVDKAPDEPEISVKDVDQAPIVPDMIDSYLESVSIKDMARELKVDENAIKVAFAARKDLFKGVNGDVNNPNFKLGRRQFEGYFCTLKSQLGGVGTGAGNGVGNGAGNGTARPGAVDPGNATVLEKGTSNGVSHNPKLGTTPPQRRTTQ